MKQTIYSILLLAGICGVSACSNGDYIASPTSNANSAVNPITPLTASEFTWGGDEPLSADINGTHWKADNIEFSLDSTGANVMVATGGTRTMYFYLRDVWSGNLYDMQYHNYKRYSYVLDSATALTNGFYYSNLGNSGEITITENDSAYLVGRFYYLGVSSNGQAASIKNGYFKFRKP